MKRSILTFMILCTALFSYAQPENSAGDVIDYREVDGKIVLSVIVNGQVADFALDIAGHCTIMESEMARLGIDPTRKAQSSFKEFVCRDYQPKASVVVDNISVGSVVSALAVNFFVLADEPYLRELGVVGTIDASVFSKYVLTIDSRRKKMTTTAPYRPPYIKLEYRTNCELGTGSTVLFPLQIDGVECRVTFDTWNSAVVALTSSDYEKFSKNKKKSTDGVLSVGYGKSQKAENQFLSPEVLFAKSDLRNVTVVENSSLKKSAIGLDFIKNGIVSLDFGKGKIYFQPHGVVEIDDRLILPKEVEIEAGKLNPITAKFFKENIFDYTKGGEFKSKADKLYVVDFWATWCGPCMGMMPKMEALAAKYKGRVVFCKVNADKEKELCNAFSVKALPTLLFIAPGGKPIIDIGALPEKFETIIETILKEMESSKK